jgi:hypothetical protein
MKETTGENVEVKARLAHLNVRLLWQIGEVLRVIQLVRPVAVPPPQADIYTVDFITCSACTELRVIRNIRCIRCLGALE